MTDDQIKGVARAINPHWWNDDIDLLDFTRTVLAKERTADEALLWLCREMLHELPTAHPQQGPRRDQLIQALNTRLPNG